VAWYGLSQIFSRGLALSQVVGEMDWQLTQVVQTKPSCRTLPAEHLRLGQIFSRGLALSQVVGEMDWQLMQVVQTKPSCRTLPAEHLRLTWSND